MTDHKFPMRYAVLAAALLQLFPMVAGAAQKDDADAAKACEDCPDTSGKSGWIEGGLGMQSDASYRFGRYTGYQDNGGLINASGAYRYRGKDNGGFLDVRVEDLGLESRDLVLEAGRQGKYDVALEYDQIPNFRESDTRSPFRAEGDGMLGLPAGWIPGSSTTTMPTLANDLARTPLKTERDRLGVKFAFIPGKNWELAGHFRREEKDGVKDMGATVYFNQSVILPVRISTQTDDFGLSMGYMGPRLQARLAYDGSLFKNDFAQIGWDNPYATVPGVASGQMADAPDNEFHQISALLGYKLSETTRLGAKFARGRMTQDEALLPYTVNPAIAGSALPTNRLDGEIDTTLAKLEINSRPADKLRLDASYTYSDRDNKTSVETYDYVVTDTLSGGLRQNRPYSFEQHLLRAKVGYRLGESDLSAGVDHDRMDRTYQQVEETKDTTLWARFKIRPADTVDATLKMSHANRDASPYTPQADEHSLMRVHNLADRDRNKAGVEVTFTPNEKLSLGLDLEYLKDDYSTMYLGLREATGITSNVNVTYAFSDQFTASAYYNHERLDSDQAGSAWITVPAADEPWLASDSNLTQTLGMTFNWVAIPKKLDVGVDLVYADYSGKIQYVNATDLPRLRATLAGIGVHGVYKLKDNLSLRAGYRYERYKESDWSETGAVDAVSSLLGLGAAPQDEDTHLVTLALRYEFK
ncbi:MAG: MtrB/PioB family decaheme-associated outer membrane protein [Hydrogenophilales bacterium]|nr:MtrB/PioB family decaheme-associated outer membrane protein [Hydrogenophilales bacterium]